MVHLVLTVIATTLDEREQLAHVNDTLAWWPVQLAILGLYVVLALLAYGPSRTEGEHDRWRILVVALGVFMTIEFLLGQSVLGLIVWPFWLTVPIYLWLVAMFLYYFTRIATKTRPGAPDAQAQARGSALEHVLGEAEAEQRSRS